MYMAFFVRLHDYYIITCGKTTVAPGKIINLVEEVVFFRIFLTSCTKIFLSLERVIETVRRTGRHTGHSCF